MFQRVFQLIYLCTNKPANNAIKCQLELQCLINEYINELKFSACWVFDCVLFDFHILALQRLDRNIPLIARSCFTIHYNYWERLHSFVDFNCSDFIFSTIPHFTFNLTETIFNWKLRTKSKTQIVPLFFGRIIYIIVIYVAIQLTTLEWHFHVSLIITSSSS